MSYECRTVIYLGFPEVNISMAKGREEDLDADLHCLRSRHLHFFYHQWLSCLPRYSSCKVGEALLLNCLPLIHFTLFL